MKKIVELLIKQADLELDELGVDTVSLVDNPAIGYEWFAFNGLEPYIDQDCETCEDFLPDNPCQEGWVAYGLKPKNGRMVPNCIKVDASMQFESITDYPEYIKEAAARGIRLNEEQGNKCGTLVGKQRAQQLAQGKPISEETVRRMYSYLSRAAVYYDESDDTACGTISYLLWGGPDALGWSERKVEELDRERMSASIIEAAQNLGEQLDEKKTTYLSAEEFAEGSTTVAAVSNAVKALDILSGKRDAEESAKTVYKYEGPISSNSRKFCRAMVGLSRTKVFSRDDINEMTSKGINSDFNSPLRPGNYDIFRFAGGSNCKHHWQEYKMFKSEQGQVLLIQTSNRTATPADSANSGFVNAEQKKKAEQWYAIQQNFATVDEDERVVVAPAMVPNVLIKRLDHNGMEYYVYFSEATIKDIAEKFFKKNYHNNTDVNHDGKVTTQNTLLESWIVEDPEKDKSAIYGFNLPKGSWVMSMRINDDETWKKIKDGELKGYSISGNFIELAK